MPVEGETTMATCVGLRRLQTTGFRAAMGLLGCRRPRRANVVGMWPLKPTGIRPARGPSDAADLGGQLWLGCCH